MLVIAHRGGDERFPENTIAAARDAVDAGADLVELDVRYSADDLPVVSHDPDLRRLFGIAERVSELPAQTFCRLRHRMDPHFGPATLQQFLEEGIGPLLLHVKEGGGRLPGLLDLLERSGYKERVILGVTNIHDLRLVKDDDSEWRVLGFVPDPELWRSFVEEGADIIRLWDGWLNVELVSDVRESGVEPWVMTGNLPGYVPTGLWRPGRVEVYRELGLKGALVNRVREFRRVWRQPKFPRLVAHRGLALGAAENTLVAFAAAAAMGAREIELDVRGTRDRQLVLIHDESLERVAGVPELVASRTLAELRSVNLRGPAAGARLATLDEVFRFLGDTVDYNVHLKTAGEQGWLVAATIDMIRRYRLAGRAYIAGGREVLSTAREVDATIERCCLEGQKDGTLLRWARELDCARLQFMSGYYDTADVQAARARGLTCNLFHAETPEEARHALAQGMHAVLTDRYDLLRTVIPEH